jgi:hypothetical protein
MTSTSGQQAKGRGRISKTAGLFLGILGVLLLVYGVAGLDPDAKRSDDGDPFGPPPSAAERIAPLILSPCCLVAGWLLIRRGERRDRTLSP